MVGRYNLDIKKDGGDAPFNMAMLYYMRLSEILNAKDRAALNHDLLGWYSALKQIYSNIYWNIKKEDLIKDMDVEFAKALKYLSTEYPTNRRCANGMQNLVNARLRVVLEKIDRDIMILLDSKKMIFPRIDQVVGLDKIREQYKL